MRITKQKYEDLGGDLNRNTYKVNGKYYVRKKPRSWGKVVLVAVMFASAIGLYHYDVWAEGKCLELGNTPQQCALLAQ